MFDDELYKNAHIDIIEEEHLNESLEREELRKLEVRQQMKELRQTQVQSELVDYQNEKIKSIIEQPVVEELAADEEIDEDMRKLNEKF